MTNEIILIIAGVIGYLLGVLVTLIQCRPQRNYNAGFNDGWDAFKDYIEDIIKKAEEEEKNAEIQRDSAGTQQ